MESRSLSSEKSHSPSMLTCAHDMGEWVVIMRRKPSLASSSPALSSCLARQRQFQQTMPFLISRSAGCRPPRSPAPPFRPG